MSGTFRRRVSRAERRREDRGLPSGRERRSAELPAVEVDWHSEPEGLVVTLANPLVVSNCFPVRDQLARYAKKFTARRIIVDLAGVTYGDTAGLGMLVEMRGVCSRLGKELLVRNLTPRLREILEILHLDLQLPTDQEH